MTLLELNEWLKPLTTSDDHEVYVIVTRGQSSRFKDDLVRRVHSNSNASMIITTIDPAEDQNPK